MSFKIGNVEIPGILVLAPMAGVTDLPFRLICKEMGADLTYTEMVSAKGLKYNNKNTGELLTTGENEHPVSAQLFGADPEIMAAGAAELSKMDIDIIDVNMGCPVPKVVNNGEGSAMMKDPDLIYRVVNAMTNTATKPVTVKMRIGFDKDHINVVECAKAAEAGGAAAVAVHGRTREDYYHGVADYSKIAEVKKNLSIPVIGNGDVNSPEKLDRIISETGVDAVMIGRAAEGNPWIFKELTTYLESGEKIARPSVKEIFDMVLRHARMMVDYKGEYTGIREMRKHVAWYTTGMPNSAKLRNKASFIESYGELEQLLMNV
jgi:nifR3 family TIM-barrel protein